MEGNFRNSGQRHKGLLFLLIATLIAVLGLTLSGFSPAATDPGSPVDATTVVPRYKPSSRSPEPLDIRTNTYGASRSAPGAVEIGDRVPDFTLPRAGGGTVSLKGALKRGPVAIIFYRGHW